MRFPQGNPPEIPGLRWTRLLGVGGLAEVHLYRQAIPARDVAVKVLRPGYAPDELAHEADILTQISAHPSIVTLLGAGTSGDGRDYLMLEYCPVTNLAESVRREPMALTVALDAMVRIASGVEALNRAGYVHGDVKPANVLISAFGLPLLSDFGLATAPGERYPEGRYSPLWASPEQAAGEPAAFSQDVWSLGTTLWTLLAGHSPFEAPTNNSRLAIASRVSEGKLPLLSRADVPAQLRDVLAASIHTDPRYRIQNAALFAKALQDVQRTLNGPVTTGIAEIGPSQGQAKPEPKAAEQPRRALPFVDPNATVVRGMVLPAEAAPAPAAPEPVTKPALKLSRFALWILLVGVVAAAVTTAVMFSTGTVVSPPASSTAPVDPLGVPDPVDGLNGTKVGDQIAWTWSHPGDVTFNYTLTSPDGQETEGTSATGSVSVAANPGTTCIEVVAVNAEGRQSTAKSSCVDA
ncbi:MAG: serine/threonine protein kinase [Propionibacteriaceae bacterium]|nr:serine/threonine protein kinase [Propionibacteriaceae bacterium]